MRILLHGALGTKAQFDALMPLLPQHEPSAALNLPGHGGLNTDLDFSLPLFAEAVLRFLNENRVEQAHLLGYSMGGYVALYLAWRHPERVANVLTINTKLDWSPEIAARMQGMMNPEKIEAKAPQMAANLAALHAPADWKEMARRTGDFLKKLGEGAGLPDAAFAQIACPITLLRGENDQVVSGEETRRVAALLPRGRWHEIANSGHLPEQIDWQAVAPYAATSAS